MKASFRQCMAWLHTWTGLVTGWVLFFVFATGTAGYVDDEITRWMQPERPLAMQRLPQPSGAELERTLARLQAVAPAASSWTITLPHHAISPRVERGLSIAWEDMPPPGHEFGRRGSETLDLATGRVLLEPEPRATAGGGGLYAMHYALHYMPFSVAIRLVGLCTMLMLLAVITGVVTHKKIFSDFFTFRPGKGQRSWLDAHNVVSVMSLPFFLMITYTGLIFFLFTYLPAGRDAIYGASDAGRQAYFDALRTPTQARLPVSAPQRPLSDFIQAAEGVWGAGQVASLQIMHPQGEVPYVALRRVGARGVHWTSDEALRYSAVDGSARPHEEDSNTTLDTQQVLFALHEGIFADWWLRWLYFISGLLGCGVIGTGLVLWTVKRRTQHQKLMGNPAGDTRTARFDAMGLRLVEVLNAGTLVGLPLGMAAYFWANRLLPLTMAGRADWELHALFLVWGWSLLFAALRPLTRAWLELLCLTAAAYALIPVLNALTTDRHLGFTVPHGDWGLAGFDLTMLGLSAVFAGMAIKVRRRWKPSKAPTTRVTAVAAGSAEAVS